MASVSAMFMSGHVASVVMAGRPRYSRLLSKQDVDTRDNAG